MAQTNGHRKKLQISLGEEKPVSSCIIQEDIAQGERIRQYKVEARVKGKWQTVCSGQSVGHKRIERFPSVEATALRLVVTEAKAQPCIIHFSVYK